MLRYTSYTSNIIRDVARRKRKTYGVEARGGRLQAVMKNGLPCHSILANRNLFRGMSPPPHRISSSLEVYLAPYDESTAESPELPFHRSRFASRQGVESPQMYPACKAKSTRFDRFSIAREKEEESQLEPSREMLPLLVYKRRIMRNQGREHTKSFFYLSKLPKLLTAVRPGLEAKE